MVLSPGCFTYSFWPWHRNRFHDLGRHFLLESVFPPQGLPQVALVIKNLLASVKRHKRCKFNSCVGKILWRRKWYPAPIFLFWKSHGQKSQVGYSPCIHKESDMTEHSTHTVDCSPPGSSVVEFPRWKYWSGLPFPAQGTFPTQRDLSLSSPALAGGFFILYVYTIHREHWPWKPAGNSLWSLSGGRPGWAEEASSDWVCRSIKGKGCRNQTGAFSKTQGSMVLWMSITFHAVMMLVEKQSWLFPNPLK